MNFEMPQISFDYTRFKRLEKRYKRAIDQNQDVFMFDGHEFYIQYAKYVLDYLRDKFRGSS